MRSLWRFIKNVWRFRRELWRWHWWDYQYSYDIFMRGLEGMLEGFRSDKPVIEDAAKVADQIDVALLMWKQFADPEWRVEPDNYEQLVEWEERKWDMLHKQLKEFARGWWD